MFTGDDGVLYVGSTPTGIGFDAPAGRHRVRVESDECTSMEQTVDISSSTKIDASLPIADPTWMGPSGAPNGFTIGLLGFHTTLPSSLHSGLHSQWAPAGSTFGVDATSTYGVAITAGYVHRFFAAHFDLDVALGSAPATGTNADGTTTSFDAHLGMIETDARVGLRYPMGNVTLEGGGGFGYGMWIAGDGSVGESSFGSTEKMTLDVPLWASVTFKPTCDLGVEFGATYHLDPLDGDDSTTMLTAGLVFEPNGACSRSPSFEVT